MGITPYATALWCFWVGPLWFLGKQANEHWKAKSNLYIKLIKSEGILHFPTEFSAEMCEILVTDKLYLRHAIDIYIAKPDDVDNLIKFLSCIEDGEEVKFSGINIDLPHQTVAVEKIHRIFELFKEKGIDYDWFNYNFAQHDVNYPGGMLSDNKIYIFWNSFL